tara:strand:+ start:4578 stop:8921 length:4344 start_codon:yes stop_codon:yes gene_type:complete
MSSKRATPVIVLFILVLFGLTIFRNFYSEPNKDRIIKTKLSAKGTIEGKDLEVVSGIDKMREIEEEKRKKREKLEVGLDEYSEYVDKAEFLSQLKLLCDIPPNESGICDPEVFDTNEEGCCVIKDVDTIGDEDKTVPTTGPSEELDLSMLQQCLGEGEEDDSGYMVCKGTNERYDYEQECCIRACSVYPINDECVDNGGFTNLVDGCCVPPDYSSQKAKEEADKAKRQMLVETMAAMLGDVLITAILPELAQRQLTKNAAKQAAKKSAQEAGEKASQQVLSQLDTITKEAGEKAAKEATEKVIEEAGEKAAKEAGEKAAKEAAEKGASEAGQKVAKEAAEKAAKEATERALKESTKKASKEAGEQAARKAGREAIEAGGERAASEAAEKASKEATERATREASEKIAKETSERAVREAAEMAAERSTKEAAEKVAKETTEKIIKESGEKAAKGGKYTKQLMKFMAGTKSAGKGAGKLGAKKMAKGLAKVSLKLASKMLAKSMAIAMKAIAKLSSGPVGWATMILDVFTILADMADVQGLNTFVDNSQLINMRDVIIYQTWDALKKEGVDFPIMFPIDAFFIDECEMAQLSMTNSIVEDLMLSMKDRIAKSGGDSVDCEDEDQRADNAQRCMDEDMVESLCKFIVINILGDEIPLAEDKLTEEESALIEYEIYEQHMSDPIKYHKKYFESMVEQFTADPKLSPTMIKFVPAMCDEVNMGISLTEEGCRYLNNQYKPTWFAFNDLFMPSKKPSETYSDPYVAVYGMDVVTVNEMDFGSADAPNIIMKRAKDVNGNDLTEPVSWMYPFGMLVSFCEKPKKSSKRGALVSPTEFGVEFDFETGVCKFTEAMCNRYSMDTTTINWWGYDYLNCKPNEGSAELSFIFGDAGAANITEAWDNRIKMFESGDPGKIALALVSMHPVGLLGDMVGPMVDETWKANKDKYSTTEEAVVFTALDPTGVVGGFMTNMADQLGGRDKWCQQGDTCKRFHAKHTGGNTQNWSVRVREGEGDDTISIYNSGQAYQNQVKDGEDHVFYIPENGYFVATATGDIESAGFDKLTGCDRKLSLLYNDISEDAPVTISSWNGCMKQKDKAKWQKDVAEVFDDGYKTVSDMMTCNKAMLGYAVRNMGEFVGDAGEEIVDVANEVGDGLEDTFGPDGYIVQGFEEFEDTAFAQWFRKDLKNFFEHDLGEGLEHAFKDKLWEEGLESFFSGAYNEDIEEWFENDVADAFVDFGEFWGDSAIDAGEALGDLRSGINDQLEMFGTGKENLGELSRDIEKLLVGIPNTAQDVVKFAEFVATGDFSAAEALLGEGLEDLADTVPGRILVGGKKIADKGFNEVKAGLRSVSKATQQWANDHLKNEVTVAAVAGLNEMVKFTDFAADKTFQFVADTVLPAVADGLKDGFRDFGNNTEKWLKGEFTDFWEADLPDFFSNAGNVIGDGTKDFFTGKLW